MTRGGHQIIQHRLQRVRFSSRRIRYSPNGILTYNPSVYKLLLSGDLKPIQDMSPLRTRHFQARHKAWLESINTHTNSCSKSVRCNQKGILCDSCESWFHCRCFGLKNDIYQALKWLLAMNNGYAMTVLYPHSLTHFLIHHWKQV